MATVAHARIQNAVAHAISQVLGASMQVYSSSSVTARCIVAADKLDGQLQVSGMLSLSLPSLLNHPPAAFCGLAGTVHNSMAFLQSHTVDKLVGLHHSEDAAGGTRDRPRTMCVRKRCGMQVLHEAKSSEMVKLDSTTP